MSKSSCKKVNAFVNSSHQDLYSLFKKIQKLIELNKALSGVLDSQFLPYCQISNILGNKLSLIAANGSVATQIRFTSADLIKQLKKEPHFSEIETIECKVRPLQNSLPSRLSTQETKNMSSLSHETAELIDEIATSIEDPKLREIMKRIAKRTTDAAQS